MDSPLLPNTPSRNLLVFGTNFVQYTADHVFVQMMASSISLIGVSSIDTTEAHPLVVHGTSVLISFVIVLVLRACALAVRGCGGRRAASVASHSLLQLPWFVRIAHGGFVMALLNTISDAIGFDDSKPCGDRTGETFLATFVVFCVYYAIVVLLASHLSTRDDRGRAGSSMATFVLECVYLACLTGSGKALHGTLRTVTATLRGTTQAADTRYLVSQLFEQAFLTLLAWWQLATVNALRSRPGGKGRRQAAALQSHEYVVVYTWAFGAVDNLWFALYTFAGGGGYISYAAAQALFWLVVVLLLAGAAALAWVSPGPPSYDFYAPTCRGGRTLSLLVFWAVDFSVCSPARFELAIS